MSITESVCNLLCTLLQYSGLTWCPAAGYRTAASIKAANDQLQHFVELLEGEGVVVRRPEELDFNVSVKTPDWEVPRMNTSGASPWHMRRLPPCLFLIVSAT